MTATAPLPPDRAPAGPPFRGEGEAPSTVPRLDAAWGSHPGVARSYNEDAIQGTAVDQPTSARGYLFLVADGMGGHNAGEVASSGAAKLIYEGYYADADPNVHRSLDRVFRFANAELYAQAQANPAQYGMGTTLTGVVIQGDRAYIAHVGDSRLYRVRGGKAEQLTQDHSWVAEQVRAGVLSPDQAEVHPQRNVITRALATAPDVKVDHSDTDVQIGDVLVLCSDGLSTEVGDGQIAALTTKTASAQEAVQKLIKLANDNGGEDNVSVAVIRILGGGSAVMAAAVAEGITEKVPTRVDGRPARGVPWLFIAVIVAVVLIAGGLVGYLALARSGPPTRRAAQEAVSLSGTAPAVSGPAATSTLDRTAEVAGAEAPQPALAAETPFAPGDTSTGEGAGEPTATLAPTFTAQPEPSLAPSSAASSEPTQEAGPPTGYPLAAAPILGDPAIGATEAGPFVRFTWNTPDRSLQAGEGYALLVWPASDPRYSGCSGLNCPAAFDACKDPLESAVWTIPDFEKGPGNAGPGIYLWTVVVVDTTRSDPDDPSRCAVISEQPPSHRFSYAPSSGPPESTAAPP